MFLNAMYGGLGQSLGAILGGKLQHKFGTVQTFLYAALFDFCFVGMVIAYLSIRKDSNFKNPTPIVRRQKENKELVENGSLE
jgi:predicted MFS family arabinose efflux permease